MKKGFTLIELLVVIVILGTLSALLVSNFMAARERARDAQRRQDLRQIQTALEMYKQDQSPVSYPSSLPSAGDCWSSSGGSSPTGGGSQDVQGVSCSGIVYMRKIPSDPNKDPADYYYHRDATDTLKYTLCACLENKADSDAETGDCSTLDYPCTSKKKIVITQD